MIFLVEYTDKHQKALPTPTSLEFRRGLHRRCSGLPCRVSHKAGYRNQTIHWRLLSILEYYALFFMQVGKCNSCSGVAEYGVHKIACLQGGHFARYVAPLRARFGVDASPQAVHPCRCLPAVRQGYVLRTLPLTRRMYPKCNDMNIERYRPTWGTERCDIVFPHGHGILKTQLQG